MEFDFDTAVSRRDTLSTKWNVGKDVLPMWIADMDFKTAPSIRNTLARLTEHGIFGYSDIPAYWAESYVKWWKERHGLEIEKKNLIFCTGVIPALSTAVRRLTLPAENVLVLTPVYNIFFNSIVNNGRNVDECPLAYSSHSYSVDFDLLEEKLRNPQTTMMILCNPHNPAGIIWSRETLMRIATLCHENGVTVFSDEIHCDITAPSKSYVPFASVSDVASDISVTALAPTKAFGIPGLQSAAVFSSNKILRHKMWRGLNTDEVAEPGSFAIDAAVAAFNDGGEWLDAMREYVFENRWITEKYIEKNIPGLYALHSDATYLVWLDCSVFTSDSVGLCKKIREKTGLYLNCGADYRGNGGTFLRMNIACPRSTLMDGLERLKRGIL